MNFTGRLCCAAFGLAGLLIAVPGRAQQLPGTVESWPTTPYRPYDAVVLSDGTPWFSAGDAVFTIDPENGAVSAYTFSVPAPAAAPQFWTLAVDGSDMLWIADGSDRLVRFDPVTHMFAAFDLPGGTFTLPASPLGVEVAADGAIWFTCDLDRSIGRYDPVGGTFQRFAPPGDLPAPPVEIAFDAAGLVYFTMRRQGPSPSGLGQLDPATGMFQLWLDPYPGAFTPFGIIRVGTQFWFLDHSGNRIVRFDPVGSTFSPTAMPPELVDPHMLVADPRGRLWFTAYASGRLGRFDPADSSFAWAEIGNQTFPFGIARTADGVVWWAQSGNPTLHIGIGVGRYTEPAPHIVPALGDLGLATACIVLAAMGLVGVRRNGCRSGR
jgi:streptogramin lyase